MIPRRGKERKGKNCCDLCERDVPPIFECSFQVYDGLTHWFDLCAKCAAVDRPVRDGFLVGIHIAVSTPKQKARIDSSTTRAGVRRANAEKRQKIPRRSRGPSTGSVVAGESKQASNVDEAAG